MKKSVNVVGGGLAGSECAYYLAEKEIHVTLYEMRPKVQTFAHKTPYFAELVCSNSFRSDDWETNAVGLLHKELRMAGSLIMQAADKFSLPAGSALGIDRDPFSQYIHQKIMEHPYITVINDEFSDIEQCQETPTVIATGPLTSNNLMHSLKKYSGEENLAFFDAIAPIIYEDTIDMSKCWKQSRWDKGKDYINCPMNEEEYKRFHHALCHAEVTQFKDWEKDTPYFEGCLPIEVMANRGFDTLCYGPMKPIGLTNPFSQEKSYAVVQLRQDNKAGTLWNMVGFQTKMTYQEQKRVIRMIPGLEKAQFARLGGIHRNSFLKSPLLLNPNLSLKCKNHVYLAGQITGVEGYVESTAIGLLVAKFIANDIMNATFTPPPIDCAFGALWNHLLHADHETFQPMNMNYGLLPPPPLNEKNKKYKNKERKLFLSNRAVHACEKWLTMCSEHSGHSGDSSTRHD